MTLAKDIIDGIADVLEALDLPEHNLHLYRRPKSLLPEDTPALVVWLRTKTPSPQTTVWFDGIYTIGVSWHEESVDEVLTQEASEHLSLSLMENMGKIEQAIRALDLGEVAILDSDGRPVAPAAGTTATR